MLGACAMEIIGIIISAHNCSRGEMQMRDPLTYAEALRPLGTNLIDYR